MEDILGELAKIKDAEKQSEKIVFDAKKKAEKLVESAKDELPLMIKDSDVEITRLRKEIDDNYGRTAALLFTKLNKDFDAKLAEIKKVDTNAVAVEYKSKIMEFLESYGRPSVEKTK